MIKMYVLFHCVFKEYVLQRAFKFKMFSELLEIPTVHIYINSPPSCGLAVKSCYGAQWGMETS